MSEKQRLFQKLLPQAILEPLTEEAKASISGTILIEGVIPIHSFPYRIGRESRVKMLDQRIERIERVPQSVMEPNNDLYLIDAGESLNISREHLQIEKQGTEFYVIDRKSSHGTIVQGSDVGDSGETGYPLEDGATIVIGTVDSPYKFRFIRFDQFTITCCE